MDSLVIVAVSPMLLEEIAIDALTDISTWIVEM
jgi:hypothetical protein